MIVSETVKTEIKTHALETPQEEVCGIVVDGKATRGSNVHDDKENYYTVDNKTWRALDNAVLAGKKVFEYHSHVHEESWYFSPEDAIRIAESNIPSILFHVPSQRFYFRDPTEVRSYDKRPWIWQFDNCWTLATEWYEREKGIILDHFQLFSPYEWEKPNWNRFKEGLPGQGFTEIIQGEPTIDSPPLQEGDLILMKVGSTASPDCPNHAAVMVDVENNRILHHLQDHLSDFAFYGSRYRRATNGIWRHSQLTVG